MTRSPTAPCHTAQVLCGGEHAPLDNRLAPRASTTSSLVRTSPASLPIPSEQHYGGGGGGDFIEEWGGAGEGFQKASRERCSMGNFTVKGMTACEASAGRGAGDWGARGRCAAAGGMFATISCPSAPPPPSDPGHFGVQALATKAGGGGGGGVGAHREHSARHWVTSLGPTSKPRNARPQQTEVKGTQAAGSKRTPQKNTAKAYRTRSDRVSSGFRWGLRGRIVRRARAEHIVPGPRPHPRSRNGKCTASPTPLASPRPSKAVELPEPQNTDPRGRCRNAPR